MTDMKAPPHLVPAWASWLTYSVSLVAGLAGVSFVGEDWPFLVSHIIISIQQIIMKRRGQIREKNSFSNFSLHQDPLWVALAANVCVSLAG